MGAGLKAVVLAGGEGSRLAPYTRVLPKPLLPVGERPILEIIVGQLRDAGVREVVLATGYLSGLIETYFGDGNAFGVDIRYAREPKALGTMGPLATIDGLDDTFLVMNGDVLTRPVYTDLVAAHRESGAIATVATRMQPVNIDFGVLRLTEDGDGPSLVEGVDEKPSYSWPVSTGIYACEPRIRDYLEPGAHADFPELIDRLVRAGEMVASFEHRGFWLDVGQLHRLEEAVRGFEGSAEEYLLDLEDDPRERGRGAPAVPRPLPEEAT